MPAIRTISIHCAGCRTRLFKYHKGGRGGLVKCMDDRILRDYTAERGVCPDCGIQFGRALQIGARGGLKIIQGKVYTKGMPRK